MKHMKILAALSVLYLLVAGFAGCTPPAGTTAAPTTTTVASTTTISTTTTAPTTTLTTETESKAITVTDMTGREIMLDAPADRIVALTASAARPVRRGHAGTAAQSACGRFYIGCLIWRLARGDHCDRLRHQHPHLLDQLH